MQIGIDSSIRLFLRIRHNCVEVHILLVVKNQSLHAIGDHQKNCSFPLDIRAKGFSHKNIFLIFPLAQKAAVQNTGCVVFVPLEWQLPECSIAVCIQGAFYSQLREPSHRTCKNAWDASCELRTQRICGVALK